jgi:SulP family sulfate permease
LLLQSVEKGELWRPLTLAALPQVRFSVLLGETINIATILVLSVVSLLLYISGLELTVKKDIDVNHELQSAGATNFIAGLFSTGPVGFHSPGLSVLGHRMVENSRLIAVVSSLILGIALFFGAAFIVYLPKFLLGGFILYLGLSFLVEWVYDGWFKLSKIDYLLVIFILISIGVFGFIEGVGIGIVVAIVLFVIKYSRINVVKHVLDGEVYQSNVDRSSANQEILSNQAKQLFILKLQGFIFFGTANGFLAQIKSRLEDTTLPAVRFIVLDFTLVNGLDSSALNSFEKLKQLAESHGFSIVLTNAAPIIHTKISLHYGTEGSVPIRFFPDLDHGVEWCEEEILIRSQAAGEDEVYPLERFLEAEFQDAAKAEKIVGYFKKRTIAKESYLVRQGDQANEIYYLEAGSIAIELELANGKTFRLRKMQAGTIVGEVGVYLGETRTASIMAYKDSLVYCLSGTALTKMYENDPDLAALFHQLIIKVLANRLKKSNKTIEALTE